MRTGPVHGGPGTQTWSTARGLSPRDFLYEIICYFNLIRKSCKKALGLLGNQPTVWNIAVRPLVFGT
jgi:hypothetical protein